MVGDSWQQVSYLTLKQSSDLFVLPRQALRCGACERSKTQLLYPSACLSRIGRKAQASTGTNSSFFFKYMNQYIRPF